MGRTVRFAGWLVLLAGVGAAACGGRPSPAAPTGPPSGPARAYLDELIGLMQAHSINRLTIDWSAFRTTVFARRPARRASPTPTRRSRSPSTRSATATACTTRPPGPCLAPQGGWAVAGSGAGAPTLPADIGYVRVPAFSGSADEATALANDLQRAIMSADQTDPIGWIVDVRGNGGGNMWPMIAGVGPVLGEGVAGYFIDPVGVETAWAYRDGTAWEGDVAQPAGRRALPAATRSTQGRRAHRQRGRQFRGSGGAVLQGAPGYPVVRRSDLWLLDRQRAVSHERRRDAEHHRGGDGRPDTNQVRLLHSARRGRAGRSGGARAIAWLRTGT